MRGLGKLWSLKIKSNAKLCSVLLALLLIRLAACCAMDEAAPYDFHEARLTSCVEFGHFAPNTTRPSCTQIVACEPVAESVSDSILHVCHDAADVSDCEFRFFAASEWMNLNGCLPEIQLDQCVPSVELIACTAGSGTIEIGVVVIYLDENVLAAYRVYAVDGIVEMDLINEL
jgi:hypothetical protein